MEAKSSETNDKSSSISVEEWLTAGCLPESAIPFLASKLSPGMAATTIVDAVFARGRFALWRKRPPTFADGFLHWSEVGCAEDIMYDCVENEEVWENMDPFSRLVYGDEGAESRAASGIWEERYADAQGRMNHFYTARERTLARSRAMKLLTVWLRNEEAYEHDGDTEKAIRRKAMSLFPSAVRETMNWFSQEKPNKRKGKMTRIEILKELIVKTCIGDEEHFQEAVFRELCIFLTVHALFLDLRTLTVEPREPEDLRLPIWAMMSKKQARDECWFDNYGRWYIMDTVPWRGQGSLAKMTLLLHALVCSLNRGNKPTNESTSNTYGYIDFWKEAMEHIGENDLGLEASLCCVKALVAFLMIDNDIYECQEYDIEEKILPELKKLLGDRPEKALPDEQTRVKDLIEKASKYQKASTKIEKTKVCRILSEAASQPLKPVKDIKGYLSDCVDRIEQWQSEIRNDDPICFNVRRMRLSGDYSKEYLLNAAFMCPSIKFLALEDCINLDEEVLEAMTNVCDEAHLVLLRGTRISENSPIVMRLRREGRIVDFSGQRCQCCGNLDTERPPKRCRVTSTHTIPQQGIITRLTFEKWEFVILSGAIFAIGLQLFMQQYHY